MREGIKVSVSPITKSSFVWFAAYIKKSNDSESKLAIGVWIPASLSACRSIFTPQQDQERSRRGGGGKNELE